MPYAIRNPIVGTQPIEETSDVKRHALGTMIQAVDPVYGEGSFIYCRGVASTVLGSAVLYSQDNYATTLLAPNDIGQVGFAMAPITAGLFGWYQVGGKAIGRVAAGFADNANCYSTATAGVIDDAVVAGDRIKQCKGASAIGTPAAGLAELEISWQFVDDGLAA